MSVLDQNGRIQALEFLARWRLISHALYYKIIYPEPSKKFLLWFCFALFWLWASLIYLKGDLQRKRLRSSAIFLENLVTERKTRTKRPFMCIVCTGPKWVKIISKGAFSFRYTTPLISQEIYLILLWLSWYENFMNFLPEANCFQESIFFMIRFPSLISRTDQLLNSQRIKIKKNE